ncbi:hypothetical protein HELRODRAFT_165898 [Helobdella robusta]|uniref:Uncharacterized protein n=1 Tax=Helobdella robusta TaxID=6412 RepID=T1EXF0_HELRO|nr:hypothetical protein HELRODRAFT_165898 [Helobdella robusta]ESN91817.1 hypothetical protein HELRODRAFT_165898 [Helobdella robusta]
MSNSPTLDSNDNKSPSKSLPEICLQFHRGSNKYNNSTSTLYKLFRSFITSVSGTELYKRNEISPILLQHHDINPIILALSLIAHKIFFLELLLKYFRFHFALDPVCIRSFKSFDTRE